MIVPSVVKEDMHCFGERVLLSHFCEEHAHRLPVTVPLGGEDCRLTRVGIQSANNGQPLPATVGQDGLSSHTTFDLPAVAILNVVHLMNGIKEQYDFLPLMGLLYGFHNESNKFLLDVSVRVSTGDQAGLFVR